MTSDFHKVFFLVAAVSNGVWPSAAKSCGAQNGEKPKPSQSRKNNRPIKGKRGKASSVAGKGVDLIGGEAG
ncbi:MAG TPA: hypothetical protein QF373_09115, partial [Verrucomicrobiota bacterium]|nr:hypothetical protein [Verrucomicrobiota bacterium]